MVLLEEAGSFGLGKSLPDFGENLTPMEGQSISGT